MPSAGEIQCFRFKVEWCDPLVDLKKELQLNIYSDETVEMVSKLLLISNLQVDFVKKKFFLKRTKFFIPLSSIVPGRTIKILGRELLVKSADELTSRALPQLNEENTYFVYLKNDGSFGNALSEILTRGRILMAMRLIKENQVKDLLFYKEEESVFVLVVRGGPKPEIGMVSPADGKFLLPSNDITSSTDDATLCIIKPHIVSFKPDLIGSIISDIEKEFRILNAEILSINREIAVEFLEVYRNVLPEYASMVDDLCSGSIVVLELKSNEGKSVEKFRNLCGHYDPSLAKVSKPMSLRAKYGVDRVNNAVHCTDLEEDGVLETDYFFHVLQLSKKI